MNTHTIESNIVKGTLLPGIHGLRGIAAISIVLYHLKHLSGIDLPAFFSFIGRDFGYSVHLFFIVSAFSLMYSTEPRIGKGDWVYEYFIKRFFRIAPLFYFMIFFELLRQFSSGKIVTGFNDIFLNFIFAFGLVPFSGFIWGGWSVGVEMIFYIVFPVLILLIRNHKTALVFLFAASLACYLIRNALHAQHLSAPELHRWDWSYFSFASNFYFFAFGLYAYQLVKIFEKSSVWLKIVIPLVVTVLIAGFWIWDLALKFYSSGRTDLTLWAGVFALFTVWQYHNPSRAVANKFLQFVGERSFSVYLLHPVCIVLSKRYIQEMYTLLTPYFSEYAFFVCALLVLSMVLIVSEITYRLIEVPGIALGRHLIRRHRLRPGPA
jgi:peptidoglycan/LPS O-acetylase OafA/YrhL